MTGTKASLQKRLATADRIIDLQKQEIARITTGEVRDIGRQKQELKRLKDENFRLNRDNNRRLDQLLHSPMRLLPSLGLHRAALESCLSCWPRTSDISMAQ